MQEIEFLEQNKNLKKRNILKIKVEKYKNL